MDTARLLKEMGIDVWRLRRDSAAATLPDAPTPVVRARAPAADAPDAVPDVPAPAAAGVVSPVPEKSVARATRPLDAFEVLCLAGHGLVWIGRPADPRTGRRFGGDLLCAAAGRWSAGQTFELITFSWPQPGVANTADLMRRALGAFVDKQCSDAADGRIMIGDEVLRELPRERLPERALRLPETDALMRDGEIKRRVWQAIEQLDQS